MTYQQFIEMIIRNVAGVDTDDTNIVINVNGRYYAVANQMTWESADDEIWGDTLIIHAEDLN